MNLRNVKTPLVYCLALVLACMAVVACGESETPPAPTAAPQPAAAPASQAAPTASAAPTAAPIAPTAAPTAATQQTAAQSEAGPSEITIVTPFAPSANGAIESDDSGILMSAGATETLLKIDFDGQVKPYLAQVVVTQRRRYLGVQPARRCELS